MGYGRSKPEAGTTSTSSTTTTTTTTQVTVASILGSTTSEEFALEIYNENRTRFLTIAKIMLLDMSTTFQIASDLENAVSSKNLTTKAQLKNEFVNLIDGLSNQGLTEGTAMLFIGIYENLIGVFTLANATNNAYNSLVTLNIRELSKATAIALPVITEQGVIDQSNIIRLQVCVSYPTVNCPPVIVADSFQNKNDSIKNELKKNVALIFKGKTEGFRNKKSKRENL